VQKVVRKKKETKLRRKGTFPVIGGMEQEKDAEGFNPVQHKRKRGKGSWLKKEEGEGGQRRNATDTMGVGPSPWDRRVKAHWFRSAAEKES